MKEKIQLIFKDDRITKSQIWISSKEFGLLLPTFEIVDKEEEIKRRSMTKRGYGWRKSKLETWEHKLFFILYYLKVYPSYDTAWVVWWVSKSRISECIYRYFPILKESLKRLWVLPPENKEEYKKKFKDNWWNSYIFIDWSEREVSRSTDYEKQKKFYSWKKRDIPWKIHS